MLCPIWLFSVVPRFRAFPVCCSGIFWMILRWFQLPYYYWYHICFYVPHELYFYCKVFASWNLLNFLLYHISVSWNCNIYWHTHPLFIITDYDVRCIVGYGCHFALVDCIKWLPCLIDLFLLILVNAHTSVFAQFYPYFLAYAKVIIIILHYYYYFYFYFVQK